MVILVSRTVHHISKVFLVTPKGVAYESTRYVLGHEVRTVVAVYDIEKSRWDVPELSPEVSTPLGWDKV